MDNEKFSILCRFEQPFNFFLTKRKIQKSAQLHENLNTINIHSSSVSFLVGFPKAPCIHAFLTVHGVRVFENILGSFPKFVNLLTQIFIRRPLSPLVEVRVHDSTDSKEKKGNFCCVFNSLDSNVIRLMALRVLVIFGHSLDN